MTRKVCIAYARSCARTEMELARLEAYLEANDCTVSCKIDDADVIVVSTCAFTADQQSASLAYLSSVARRKRAGSAIVVAGCLPGIDPHLADTFNAFSLTPSTSIELDELIGATKPLDTIPDQNSIGACLDRAHSCFSKQDHFRTWLAVPRPFRIRLARGCASECTYCAIRRATGLVRSKPLDNLLALRRISPRLSLRTHVLLGFPGETRRDFLDTWRLVRSAGFERVIPYTYSRRYGTPAADMDGQLSHWRKAMRTWEFRLRLRLIPSAASGASPGQVGQ